MFKTIITLIAISGLLVACGNDENSIPYKASIKTNVLPQSLEEKALSLSQQGKSLVSSVSSRNIKHETIGVNLDITNKNTDAPEIKVTVSYSQSPGTCSQALYRGAEAFDSNSLATLGRKIEIEEFGNIQCMVYDKKNKRCDFLFVMITQTPSSVVADKDALSRDDGMVPAAVFLVMENMSGSSNSDQFVPAQFQVDNFLKIPRNETEYQFCMKPQQIIQNTSDILYPIDPTGDLDEDYYYEDYYNNYDFGGFYN